MIKTLVIKTINLISLSLSLSLAPPPPLPPLSLPPFPPSPPRLADLMEEHQEELATIESMDSGAVYTLALKTHVGMSIQTFRYFAGWCDKIQVHSRDLGVTEE